MIMLAITVSNIYCQKQNKETQDEILLRANHCFEKQQYDSAAFLYRKHISATISSLNRKNPDNREIKNTEAQVAMQIANICTLKEEYQDAESWYYEAIKLADSLSILKAEIYQNLGSLYLFKEHYEYAILYYQKSWSGYSKDPAKNSGRIIDLLTSLGTAYSRNGEFLKSYNSFHNADSLLRISEKNESLQRAGLNVNIGEILVRLDAPEKALFSYRSACELASGDSFSPINIRLSSNQGMAECYSRLGQPDSAMICLENCFKLIQKDGSDMKHDSSRIFLLMGDVEMRQKAWEKSIKYYHKALEMLLPDSLGLRIAESDISKHKADLLDLYKIYGHMGRSQLQSAIQADFDTVSLSLSFSDFILALKICDHISNDFGQESSRMTFREKTKPILAGALESGLLLKGKEGNKGFDDLFLLADVNKNRLLLEDIEENHFMLLSGIPDSTIREIRGVKDKIVFYSRKIIKEDSSPGTFHLSGLNEMQNKVIDLKLKLDSLKKKTEQYFPDYATPKYHIQKSYSAGIMKSLKNDQAMLEYFCYDSIIYLFLIRNEGLSMERVVVPSSFHSTLAECLHELKCGEIQNFSSLSHILYTYLIAPVEDRLKRIHSLIIIPDEKLSLFPFETLICDDLNECSGTISSGWHYLLKDFEISYHFSAEAWFKDTVNTGLLTTSYRFAGFAPGFYSTTDKQFSLNPLPSALKEVKGIAELFNQVPKHRPAFIDTSATEKNFRLNAPENTHIHIATHSFISDRDPMNSALIFSGSGHQGDEDEMNDGLLHLDEINNLQLDASLVVLSACGTGEGKVTRTEGVLAFTRGFYLAGASNIVYSLWNIPDRLTGGFMLDFYRNYFSGKSYEAALRNVKLKMIARPETSLPYLWAGIVLLGRD
jgi:CHAT domain-containing protein/tetratricopeptide (TPR) repeat protein